VKGFVTVARVKLWSILYKKGIPHHLIAVIKNIYKGTEISLITNSGKVLTAGINLEVRQGRSMLPILLNFYLDDAVRHWQL
jgi:hypothetical protein